MAGVGHARGSLRGRWRPACWLALCLAGLCACAGVALAQQFDPRHSRVGFVLETRWGQTLEGVFPRYDGGVIQYPDGRRQVRLRLHTAAMKILGHPRYTDFARGEHFFDVSRHPYIEFVSEPYSLNLLLNGGELSGRLRMLGVEHEEVFQLEPARCTHPGRDCAVIAHGTVDRNDYGLDGWQIAIRDDVQFDLRMRLAAPEASP